MAGFVAVQNKAKNTTAITRGSLECTLLFLVSVQTAQRTPLEGSQVPAGAVFLLAHLALMQEARPSFQGELGIPALAEGSPTCTQEELTWEQRCMCLKPTCLLDSNWKMPKIETAANTI